MMLRTKKSNHQITFLLISFLSCYVFISLFVDFLHNHEEDYCFHDNCPACQWQKQHQDDHSEFKTILEYFTDVLNTPIQNILQENSYSQNRVEITFYFSRAPPTFI